MPKLEYIQNYLKSCCLNSLDYLLFVSGAIIYAYDILGRIGESLVWKSYGYYDVIIMFNAIILDQSRKKGEHSFCCKTNQWKINGSFEMLNYISEHVTLVYMVYTVGYNNHAVIIAENRIFDSNDDKSLP